MSEPTTRRRRLWPWVVLAVLALASFAIWWWRDLPRRRIEATLEDELRADVDVGRLSILGKRRFAIHGVRVRRMGGQPYLEVAEVDTITVEGALQRLRVADFERMEVTGVTLVLRPPTGEPLPEPSTEPSTLKVGRLTLRNGAIVVRAGGVETRLPFQATVDGIGTDAVGEVSAQAPSLPLNAVLALVGFPGSAASLQGLEASIRLEKGGGAALAAKIAAFVLPDQQIPGGRLTASLAPAADGRTLLVSAQAQLSLARELHGQATLEAASLAPLSAEVHAKGVDVGEVVRVVPMLPAGASLDGTADVDVTLRDPQHVEVATTASFSKARLVQGPLQIDLSGAQAQASASLIRDQGPLRGPARARLRLPGVEARGAIWHVPAKVAPATLDVDVEVASVTPPALRGKASLLTSGMGTWSGQGRIEGTPLAGDLTWSWTGLTLSMLRAASAELGVLLPEPLVLEGRALLRGTLRGPLAAPAVAGTLVADRIEAAWGAEGKAFTGGNLETRFGIPPGAARVEVPALALAGTAVLPPLSPVPVHLEATGRWETAAARLTLARAAVQSSPGLGTLSIEGTWQRGASTAGSGRVRLADAGLPAWLPVLRPLLGDPVAGYTVRGTAGAEGTVQLASDGRWTGEGKASIAKSGFVSDDGARVLEGLDSSWTLHGQGWSGRWQVQADADVAGFQLLWGSVFGDYSGLGSRAQIESRGGVPGEPPWNVDVKMQIPEGPHVELAFHPHEPEGMLWSGSLQVVDLARTVARHLRAPLGESLPLFERIEAKGRLEVHASGVSSERTQTMSGGLTLEGVDLAGTQGVVGVSGLDLLLPFDLRWEEGADGSWSLSGPPGQGSVEFDHMEVSGLTLAALKSGLVLVGDDLTFEETLTIPVLGGEVRFEALTLADLFLPSRHLSSGVLVTGVALAEISRSFALPPLEGSVEALFPHVRLDAGTLLVEGGGEVRLFGGSVRLGDISGQDVLSRFPKLQLSAEFSGIDLGRVTRTFDFGEMNGVVEGYARDLRLFRGVPVSFEASIHSVPTKGVPQNVNVKAVRNLTILGTGARISPLDRGLQRFFDKYTYAELGVWMKLQADVFVLRGTAGSRGDRELFVRGRLPFPINIVNAQPGKTISFSSMVERVKSVDFSAATSKPSAP